MSEVFAIVVAAGRGTRAGDGLPKQYRPLGGRPLLCHSIAAFLADPRISLTQTVIHRDDAAPYEEAVSSLNAPAKLLSPVSGGANRQASVRAGLESLAARNLPGEAIVLVHDAARPFLSRDLLDRAIAAAETHGAAVPGVAVSDTIKQVDEADRVKATPDRARLRAIQTPQAFRFAVLLAAHRRAAVAGLEAFTDDGALAEWAGLPVHVFPGDAGNLKVTQAADFAEAERRLGAQRPMLARVGTGYDVHAFATGDHIWLGGVRIPHDKGVTAHSDGDVVLHALTDAVLGALAEGDIGTHFPPSDARWKNARSDTFLAHAVARVTARGGNIDHLDATVVCEAPRVGPHREAMRQRIATIAGIPLASVSIKATTSEGLGFTGRREGIAAQATATLRLPAGI
jgi:2-C-methyl-D-erythritol 4-phosphate cytidylyltransferase / 2-C-methyl-D-erythritol 2,4-cyclodiphosphate synthase